MQRYLLTNYPLSHIVIFASKQHQEKEIETMIELKSTAQLSKAIDRAKASKLLVRFVQFRQFRVENRANGKSYNVNFFVRAGKRFGHCDCKGGERGLACKHLAAAAAVQTGIAAMRRSH
jgi:uncharacterized Zn finger protein